MGAPCWALLAAALIPVASFAKAPHIKIQVLTAQYSTDLRVDESSFVDGVLIPTHTASTNASPSPISDELLGTRPAVFARASAAPLSVSVRTSAFDPTLALQFAQASARTDLTFSTQRNALAPLSFDFLGSGQVSYSDGLVSLYDVTAGQSMFSRSWTCCGADANPLAFSTSASLAFSPWLLASHVYALSMAATTYANMDAQSVSISLSGLKPMLSKDFAALDPVVSSAPESSTLAMTLVGLVPVVYLTRKKKWLIATPT